MVKTSYFITVLLLIAGTISSSYAVCIRGVGSHSPIYTEEENNIRKQCSVDSDCAILGCWEALNSEVAKDIVENHPESYIINCSLKVNDADGNCLLTPACVENRCEIAEHLADQKISGSEDVAAQDERPHE